GYRNYFTGGAFQQGVDGYYWSSEAAGSSTGYDLYFHSSGVNPLTNYHDYNYSLSVRCVRQ
ncbi:MAG: fibrobacter succinogenes major paralogous domain-containing protein, partial [Alistipes sp.]|nr:fibrobacter succinogenes major paralogous domain-containing protein [Alistipes sp.]